jgi:hypothetical protein
MGDPARVLHKKASPWKSQIGNQNTQTRILDHGTVVLRCGSLVLSDVEGRALGDDLRTLPMSRIVAEIPHFSEIRLV